MTSATRHEEHHKEEEEPPAHMTLATFAAAIFEINKCALTEPNEAVADCSKRLDVCKSYVDSGATFGSTYEALPIQAIQYRMDKVKKGDKTRQETGANLKIYQEKVGKMANLNDFRNVLVTLIAAAKCGGEMPGLSQQVRAISDALSKFKWDGLKTGTLDLFVIISKTANETQITKPKPAYQYDTYPYGTPRPSS